MICTFEKATLQVPEIFRYVRCHFRVTSYIVHKRNFTLVHAVRLRDLQLGCGGKAIIVSLVGLAEKNDTVPKTVDTRRHCEV